MNYSQVRNVLLPALMILLILVNPIGLLAATESSESIEKLKQFRLSQNRQTMIANVKANSTEVTRGDVETTGLAFRQALQKNEKHQLPEIKSSRAPGFHNITPSYEMKHTASTGTLAKAVVAGPGIFVNGKNADTLLIGSEPYFSINLPSALEGVLVIYWDRNHNGITDSVDIPIEEYDFTDNDQHDLDPTVGTFEFLYDQEMADGLNYVVDDFLYTVYTADGEADAAVTYYTDPSPYYVTGTVRDINTNDPLEGVIVWGDYAWYDMGPMPMEEDQGPTIIAITDTAGNYTLFFPDTGYVVIGTWDHLMTTGGLIPADPQQVEFPLVGLEIFDFYYREPLARIWGTITDDMGNPLYDVEVRASYDYADGPDGEGGGGGNEFYGFTDSSGYYEIGVDPGWFWVEVDGKDLIPDFMIPEGQSLEVTETGVNTADFVLLVPNSSISGTVLLDGLPYPEAMVQAWSWEIGWNIVWTDMSGNYDIPVFDPVTVTSSDSTSGPGGYELRVHLDEDPGIMNPIIQVSENWGVLPGTTGEDILLQTVTGGISGTFFNAQDNQPIIDGWDIGLQAMNLDNGMYFWTRPNEHDGTYQLWLVDGMYEIMAGGMDWYGPEPDTIEISGGVIPYDIYLEPVNYQGIFDGRVLDDITNNPIAGADINIGNEFWGNHAVTDSAGYFHFELPNGYYGYHVKAPGYLEYFSDVNINDNYEYHEVRLQELIINGAITGVVFDGFDTVVDAMVNVWNPTTGIGFHTWTDSAGTYWFDLPNGIYDIYVEHSEHLPYWDSGLWVSNDTLVYDVTLNTADGFISGHVYDQNNMMSIENAGIYIVSRTPDPNDPDYFPDYGGMTDENGDFSIPVKNGGYDVHVNAPGYEPTVFAAIGVNFTEVILDVPMLKRAFEGPIIHTVYDQPNDQGRWVRMEFGPEGMNAVDDYQAFSIWRLTQTPMGPFYDFIAYVPSRGMQFYSLVAPTLIDSNKYTSPMEYESEFMITGHYDDWDFIDGGINFGYSKDNIHPGVPSSFTLTAITTTYSDLQWNVSADDDFQYFELYRSTDGDFAGLTPIAQLVETNYHDEISNAGMVYHYMLKAVDANGNISDASRVVRTFTTSLGGKEQLPDEYSLNQNYPNPFNPTTLIEFALPLASEVSLEIYNILGQHVRTLANGYTPGGYLSVNWDGLDQNGMELSSGTYIYRLQAADITLTKKMVLMK